MTWFGSQLAIDDFVDTCREAYTTGIGVNELQLQLLLAEGSLSGPYAVTSQEFPVDPVMDEVCKPSTFLCFAPVQQTFKRENCGHLA